MVGAKFLLFLLLFLTGLGFFGSRLGSLDMVAIGPSVKVGRALSRLHVIVDIAQHRNGVAHHATARRILGDK